MATYILCNIKKAALDEPWFGTYKGRERLFKRSFWRRRANCGAQAGKASGDVSRSQSTPSEEQVFQYSSGSLSRKVKKFLEKSKVFLTEQYIVLGGMKDFESRIFSGGSSAAYMIDVSVRTVHIG